MMLITEDYAKLLRQYRKKVAWGKGDPAHWKDIEKYLVSRGCESFLDYGCGHGALTRFIEGKGYPCVGYDPGVAKYADNAHETADGLICVDVLEHVEPECLSDVLHHMRMSFTKAGYLVIHLSAAKHKLPDGRNAHLIQNPAGWWLAELAFHRFRIEEITGVCSSYLGVVVTNGGQ